MGTGYDVQLAHVMGIRQIIEQGLHRAGVLRMYPVRSEFGHRRQDKSPLMKTGVWNGESRGLDVDDPSPIEQHIQIHRAGDVLHKGLASEASFRFLTNGQHVFPAGVGFQDEQRRYKTTRDPDRVPC